MMTKNSVGLIIMETQTKIQDHRRNPNQKNKESSSLSEVSWKAPQIIRFFELLFLYFLIYVFQPFKYMSQIS